MLNEEGDPKQHLTNFQEECILKLGTKDRLMTELFIRILKVYTSDWFYKLSYRYIHLFGEIVKLCMDHVMFKYFLINIEKISPHTPWKKK